MDLFRPQSVENVLYFDAEIRAKLAKSLLTVFEQAFGIDRIVESLTPALTAIRAHRQVPGVFARYFDLVFAVRAKRFGDADRLLQAICALAVQTPSLEVRPLTEAALGDDAARFSRLLDASASGPIFGAPEPMEWQDFGARVAAALGTLDEIDAALAAEARALIVLVVGSVPSVADKTFGSASSLTLWGAVVMNLRRHTTLLDLIDGLVHEAAHLVLFGLARHKPLLANAASERYASPLRRDLRPIDGVFHATFVCARLHLLYSRLLERRPDTLAALEDAVIWERRARQQRAYADGAATIAAHGRPNKIGSGIMEAMATYMNLASA